MKRAQISGQALIFVLALIVTAAILIFGYKAIQNLGDQQQKIELVKFQDNFRQKIKDTAYSYGSSKRVSLVMPKGFTELCLVDKELPPLNSNLENPIILDVWGDDASQDNAFLLKIGSQRPDSFYAGNLSVDGNGNGKDDRDEAIDMGFAGDAGFLCMKSTGSTLSFILEGRGMHTMVRK